MNLPKLEDLDVSGKKVLVRADLDVGEEFGERDIDKLKTILPTLQYLLEKNAKIILIGHRGRPAHQGSGEDQTLSLKSVSDKLSELLNTTIDFVHDISGQEAKDKSESLNGGEVMCLENLRFDPREEANDEGFARSLADLGEIYINEAFSASHRDHASIVGVPKLLPPALGFHFLEEIKNLKKVLESPRKPVLFIISGVKKDKLEYLESFLKFADKILIAGRLPDFIDAKDIGRPELEPQLREVILKQIQDGKIKVSDLVQDKEDITIHSIEKFEIEVEKAGTIVVSGPVGKFEDEGHRQGTKRVFEAISENKDAFKVAGGGDTEQAIKLLGLVGKFDWISIGGGASLEFLAKGTLPGIEAVKK